MSSTYFVPAIEELFGSLLIWNGVEGLGQALQMLQAVREVINSSLDRHAFARQVVAIFLGHGVLFAILQLSPDDIMLAVGSRLRQVLPYIACRIKGILGG